MENNTEKKMPIIGIVQIDDALIGPLILDKIASSRLGTGVLISNIENLVKMVTDIQKAYGGKLSVFGGSDYSLLRNSEIVIITGGISMKPGMTREDLTQMNAKAFSYASTQIREVAPEAEIVLAPFGVTYSVTLREIVHTVSGLVKHPYQISLIWPPEKEDTFECEGPFTLSERILGAVKDLV